jgi:hypothetical protein
MRKIVGRTLAVMPPLLGVASILGSPTTAGAAPAFPTSPTGTTTVRPPCSPNWQVVYSRAMNRTDNGAQYGTVDLWYDSCSRDVKAQVINAPVPSGFVGEACLHLSTENSNQDEACAEYFTGSGATTGPYPDAGLSTKAVGSVILSQTVDSAGYTPYY